MSRLENGQGVTVESDNSAELYGKAMQPHGEMPGVQDSPLELVGRSGSCTKAVSLGLTRLGAVQIRIVKVSLRSLPHHPDREKHASWAIEEGAIS